MSVIHIIYIAVGLLTFLGLKRLFDRKTSFTEKNKDLIDAYVQLKQSSSKIAEQKRVYEESLNKLKSSNKSDA